MSHKARRALKKATGQLGAKQLKEDVCQVCAFIASSIIAHREQDFVLPDGTVIEIGVNKRLEPPLGIRFPRSAARREKCLVCSGIGKFGCDVCVGSGEAPGFQLGDRKPCQKCNGAGKIACEKCQGLGYNWSKDDFAPTCPLCSQFIMAWLAEREQRAMMKGAMGAAASKIILPSAQQAGRLTKGIILPGRS